MFVVRKLACGVMCFAAMIASATVTTNLDSYVEYIQSSGTQWIDTGVIGKSTVNIAADVTVLSSAGSSCFIGERPGTDANKGRDLRLGIWINNSYKWALNCGTIDSGWIGSISYQNSRCVVSNENGRLWVAVNDGTPTKIHDGADQTFTSSLTLTMFFLNTSSGLDQGSNRAISARVYGLTLHDSGTLVRDFHPCRVTITDTDAGTSVSKNGLWDEVDDCFYGDLSGGTDFTAGADVVAAKLVILPIPDQINETFGTSCPECVVSNMNDNSFWTVGGAIASPLFDVEYADNDGTGVAKVTVTGKDGGAFAGKHAVQTFNIVATKQEDENIISPDPSVRRRIVDGKYVYIFKDPSSAYAVTAKRGIVLEECLLVGGGGGGGSGCAGGGGGGGGVTNATSIVGAYIDRDDTFTVAVGAGGGGSTAQGSKGGNGGETSIAFGLFGAAVAGGGGGGSWNSKPGAAGGSGGGSSQDGAGGAGIDGIGFAGAGGGGNNTGQSGGGGGAGHAGYEKVDGHSGNGGEGIANDITGVEVVYGGGGGGGGAHQSLFWRYDAGLGGIGGGGDGGKDVAGENGVDGLGGGGGGGGAGYGGSGTAAVSMPGGKGGSGIAVLVLRPLAYEIVPIADQIHESFDPCRPEFVVSNRLTGAKWTVGGDIASEYFDVEYENNIGVGTAKVTITGKGACAEAYYVRYYNITATKYEDANIATTDLSARRLIVDGKSVYVFTNAASAQVVTAKRDINLIDYLVVGGGGGGGHTMAGGGGAGGVTNATGIVGINVSQGETFTVVVGAGGIGSRSQTDRGGKGGTSSLQFGLLSVAVPGGGGGGSWSSAYVNVKQGGAGACGGGGCQDGTGGAGVDGFGFAGGAGAGANSSGGGGGGGAGEAGYAADTTAKHAGYGGEGVSNNITGVWVVYGGGGGGGGSSYGYNQYTAGLGGLGGGGDGGRAVDGYPGVDGLGGGGGGGGRDSGGNKIGGAGGSGTVIFAIKAADFEVDPIPDQYLAAGGCEPLPVVRDGATILVKDTDYTVAYANNTQAGAATLTITGIGTYDGKSATVGFKIISRYFAKPSVSSGGDGLSWATAMSVAEAFAAVAAGTGFREIWIQSGTVSQPEISIVNSGALVVRGGFAGTEAALSDRQPGGLTIFDGERAVNILLTIDNETVDNVVFDRLKLCRAKFNGLVKTGKGGLQAYDCVIEGNGLDARKGNNVWGRGMKLESDGYGSLVISNCVVAGNRNAYDDSQQGGFGLYISKFNDARIDNSLFVTNGYNIANAASAYCGMYSRGSAILAIDTPIFVRGSRFAGNCCPVHKSVTSSDGSGGVIALIGAGDGSRFENCAFVGNTECLSMGVSGVVNTGGALAICLNNSSAKATVSNCTFAYNISQGGASAGGITVAGGNVDIANSIFWKNARYNYTTSGYGTDVQVSSGSASISHSLVTTLDGTALFGANLTVDTDTVFAIDPLLVTSTAAYEALLTVTDSAMYYNTGNANRYADLASMDVHLLSPAGYVVNGGAFGPATNACSSAIDAGDPDADYANEPSPNGDRLNLGAYGNTAEASRTPTGQPMATVAVVFPGGEARPMAQVTMGLESGSGYMATVHVLCSINGVTLAEETFYKVANGDVLELKSPSYLPQGTKFDVAVTITASGAESKHYETSELVSGTYPAYYGKGGGANVIHVRTGADGYMDGSNWEHAYPDLRAAFAAAPDASKTEVWLSVTNDYLDAAMTLDHSLTFRGGFTGAEDEPSERPEGLRSLLWGNNYYKTMQIAVPSGMLLTVDRVHFTHSGDSELKKTGAGDLIVRDCVFADSRQDSGDIYGRGIYASGGTVSVTNCQFRNLTCPNGSQPGSGIYLTSCVQAYVDDCLFVTNGTGFSYNSPGWSGHRAAAAFVNATPTIFRNCRFAACCAALYDSNASGGIVSFAGASGGSKMINCALVGNSDFESLNCPVSYSGGAISCVMSAQDQTLDIENCTVAYNLTLGTRSSAGITVHTGTVNLKNSIVYGNVLGKIGNLAAGADIEVKANGTLNMTYTLVTGLESNYVNAVEGATTNIGVGVICVDPLLATTTNDFQSLFSPNPNAGNNPTYWYLTQGKRGNCAALDVHPRTYTGYMLNGVLIKDPEKVESPTIDAGDPNSDRSKEPTIPGVGYPGKSVNLGAYGNTPEAAMTRLPGFYLLLR